jgi:hypothetical protein
VTIEELISDIRATFPGIGIQQRMQHTTRPEGELAWMISGHSHVVMPDGLPIFQLDSDDDNYTCFVHSAFDAWLSNRGWYLENYDDFWFWPTELPGDEEIAALQARWASVRSENVIDDGCPF